MRNIKSEMIHKDVDEYVLVDDDVGRMLDNYFGRVIPQDVGKMIFLRTQDDGTEKMLYMENREQFLHRIDNPTRHERCPECDHMSLSVRVFGFNNYIIGRAGTTISGATFVELEKLGHEVTCRSCGASWNVHQSEIDDKGRIKTINGKKPKKSTHP